MYSIVFDLEMTMGTDENICYPEIIEIGAVKLDDDFNIISKFQTFVKPLGQLSAFCSKLTNISESDLVSAPNFEQALNKFIEWIGLSDFLIYAWSQNDKKQFYMEAKMKNINISILDKLFFRYGDIQKMFMRVYRKFVNKNYENLIGLKTVADILKFDIDISKYHRADFDAEITALVLRTIKIKKIQKILLNNENIIIK